jgi:hypothetical protein
VLADATVASRLGAGNGCETTLEFDTGRDVTEPVMSWREASRFDANGLESKRAEFSQPATATPTRTRTATRGQTRGRDGTLGRDIWLLTHTHND